MYTGIVEPKSITFATDLRLESGRIIGPITLAYETYGELNAERSNAVLVAHAWTGSAHLAGKYREEEQKPGWWDAIVAEHLTQAGTVRLCQPAPVVAPPADPGFL